MWCPCDDGTPIPKNYPQCCFSPQLLSVAKMMMIMMMIIIMTMTMIIGMMMMMVAVSTAPWCVFIIIHATAIAYTVHTRFRMFHNFTVSQNMSIHSESRHILCVYVHCICREIERYRQFVITLKHGVSKGFIVDIFIYFLYFIGLNLVYCEQKMIN